MSVNNSITSGTIAIEDGTKAKEEFAPARKVKVELSFSVPEGQDGTAYMHGVARVAEQKVASMLGRTAPAEVAQIVTATAPKPAETPKTETPKPETAAAKKKREAAEKAAAEAAAPKERTKADLEREMLEAAGAKKPASDDELLEDEPTITATGAVVSNDDDLGDLLGEAAPPPVTDLELGKAAQEKNAKMKAELGEAWAPAKIRDLISRYSDGKRINDIAAAKRPQFLKELNALT